MAKSDMSAMLKRRMTATQQASELQLGDEVYEKVFQQPAPMAQSRFAELPIEKLIPFFTADIGFMPYPTEKLEAFSKQLATEGLFERVIVRAIPGRDTYEILAGHNRTNAGRMADWATIPCEIVEADDERATTIAISTNLLRRQDLTIIERGKAYKALLDAQRKQGFRNDLQTSGEIRQKFLAREVIATFFGVTEYEIRKAIKMTQLIPDLQNILVDYPKLLPLSCAEKIADYDEQSQRVFIEMCSIEGYHLTIAAVDYIVHKCPPPRSDRQALYAAWRETRVAEARRAAMPPKKISFDRKKFAPYLDKLGSDQELEKLFLEFLQERVR